MADDLSIRQHKSRGPHGLGDPDDNFLRKVEKEVIIPKLVRERSRQEKCIPEVAAFCKCAKENGLLMTFKCKPENEVLKGCLAKWFHNEAFREECKQQYLQERSEFRRTGVSQKEKKAGSMRVSV